MILFFCCAFISYGQPSINLDKTSPFIRYYEAINRADSLRLHGSNGAADALYAQAFKQVEKPFKHDCVHAFENALGIDKTKALTYLKKGCDLGVLKKQMRENSFFESLSKKEQSNAYQWIKKADIPKNDSLVRVINKMVKADQKARVFWTDWLKWEKQVKIMDKADRPNAAHLLQICQKMGWPGFSLIGDNTLNQYRVEDVSLLILHFSKEEYSRLLPYMIKAVEDGEMYPYQLARCTDYLYMGTESDSAGYRVLEIKQLYGTMYSGNEIIPFGSIEEVNARRRAIGLGSIENYCMERNLTLPTVEKNRYISPK